MDGYMVSRGFSVSSYNQPPLTRSLKDECISKQLTISKTKAKNFFTILNFVALSWNVSKCYRQTWLLKICREYRLRIKKRKRHEFFSFVEYTNISKICAFDFLSLVNAFYI